VTKLGRLVKDGKIKSLEEIYLFSLPIKAGLEKTQPSWFFWVFGFLAFVFLFFCPEEGV
jgi:hypothetical protein